MPRKISFRQARIFNIIETLSAKQIKNGVSFTRQRKLPKLKKEFTGEPDEKPYKIVPRIKRVSGVNLSLQTIRRIKRIVDDPGDLQRLSKRTLHELDKLYLRISYNELKASGASTQEARAHYRSKPKAQDKAASDYKRYAEIISKNKNIPLPYILYGMTQSEKRYEDWERYIRARGYK